MRFADSLVKSAFLPIFNLRSENALLAASALPFDILLLLLPSRGTRAHFIKPASTTIDKFPIHQDHHNDDCRDIYL
jgi:hypothetical protein